MAERVNVSESKKGSKFPWDFIIFIISIAGSAYGNFFRVYNATNLTPGDKFFYFLTIMWYLYFPGMFAEYYGNPEKSNKSNKFNEIK